MKRSSTDYVFIAQGEYAVSADPSVYIQTLLGSCVGCAMWDSVAGVGGMNHVLLPSQTSGSETETGAQVNMMELLINGILKKGGQRSELKAKVFGGARMIEGLSRAGEANVSFVGAFLEDEGIPCLAKSIGGAAARKIQFWPTSGRVRLKVVRDAQLIAPFEPLVPVPISDDVGELDLF